jgi:hypothetical protein
MNYSVQSIVPSYTFHDNTDTVTGRGNRFNARPIRQWRKQLQATNGLLSYRRTAVGIPSDRPGGASVTTHSNCKQCNGASELKDLVNKKTACTTCHITRTSISVNDNSYTDSDAYLQSKCETYDQKLAYNPVSSINYFSPQGLVLDPTNSPIGSQVRETNNCYSTSNCFLAKTNIKCNTTIYKPNNSQFAQQGGVNSGSRISRLKYNTLNNYGAQFNSAAGAVGVNTGRYITEPSPSYYNKLQPQKVVFPYKIGNKTYCRPQYSLCYD